MTNIDQNFNLFNAVSTFKEEEVREEEEEDPGRVKIPKTKKMVPQYCPTLSNKQSFFLYYFVILGIRTSTRLLQSTPERFLYPQSDPGGYPKPGRIVSVV